ncbi:MAG: DNA-methyltransferase [Candidatus Electrothrix sp. YB6]
MIQKFYGHTKSNTDWTVYKGDALKILKELPAEHYNCVVTSPPYYWLRDYGVDGQIGIEDTVEGYVDSISNVMDEVYRVIKQDGVLFLNIGDTYYSGKGKSHGVDKKSSKRRFGLRAVDKSGGLDIGVKPKSLIGIPWRVALEMCKRNWVLRSPIIWYRKHSLPESVQDRPRRSYEHIFMFVKNRKYYFNRQALEAEEQEDMWTISARPKGTHIGTAPYPDELVQRCLDIGCPIGGSVLDPFAGGGTTLRVAVQSGCSATGIDLNPEFCQYIVESLSKL